VVELPENHWKALLTEGPPPAASSCLRRTWPGHNLGMAPFAQAAESAGFEMSSAAGTCSVSAAADLSPSSVVVTDS
jgi:hypothetical protein